MDKTILENLEFYKNYFKESIELANKLKYRYLHTLSNDKLYKFIQFSDDNKLNKTKLESLYNKSLWFGCFWTMNDPTEFEMNKNKTDFNSMQEEKLYDLQTSYLQELYNLCSFTYENNDLMWKNYSNNYNGFCLCFKVKDFDWFYPVEYVSDKSSYSFVSLWREANIINKMRPNEINNTAMALLPYLIKDRINVQTKENSTFEKEIRAIYCTYSEDDENNGILKPGYKKENRIYGNNVPWNKLNLFLDKIIIGKNCSEENKTNIRKFGYNNNVKIEDISIG